MLGKIIDRIVNFCSFLFIIAIVCVGAWSLITIIQNSEKETEEKISNLRKMEEIREINGIKITNHISECIIENSQKKQLVIFRTEDIQAKITRIPNDTLRIPRSSKHPEGIGIYLLEKDSLIPIYFIGIMGELN